MRRFLGMATLVACAVIASNVSAEPLQAGKEYAASTKIEVPSLNVGFTLPASTSGGLPPGSEFFMLGSTSGEPGRVFLWAAQRSSEQMVQIMAQAITIDIGLMLTPKTTPKVSGNTITADYDATDGSVQYRAHVKTTVGKNGVSVAVITVAPPEGFPKFQALADTVTKSLKFTKPKPAAVAKPGSTGSGSWAKDLRNMQLIRFSHGSGYSEKEYYSFCANGRFYHHFDASSVSMNGTGAADSNDRGQWSASGNNVTLRFDNGESSTVALNLTKAGLFINGTRWYREAKACQ